METPISPEQEALFLSPASTLDQSRGVIDIPLAELEGVDPERRITLARMAGMLGRAIADTPPSPHADYPLDVYRKNFLDASPDSIEHGLYIPPSDSRFARAELLVTVSREPCNLDLPGVVLPSVGVVFPKEEFAVVARNARDLVKHVKAQTLKANGDHPDRDEAEAKAHRSAAHAMEGKLQGLNTLDNELIGERKLLGKIFREAKSSWSAHYKAKNLDRDRKLADELIHNAAETASINLNLGTVALNAMHRAIVSSLYRRGSSRELNLMWQTYTSLTGRYANARRGKVSQSRNACEKQLAIYAPSLEQA
jgi:hypothetical protein